MICLWKASKCIKDKYKILQSKKNFLAHTLLTVQGQLSPFGQIISGELLRTVGIGGTLIGSAFSASVQCAAFQCAVCSGSGNSVAFSCQCTACSTLGVRASVRCRPSTCQHQPPTSNRESGSNRDPASTTTKNSIDSTSTPCVKCDQWEPKYLWDLSFF